MTTEKNKYQDSLNLPDASFPMRAGLPKREPEQLKQWQDTRLYARIQDARKDAPLYVLHDGPPYANGRIHTGTAMNKILKDIAVKHATMKGFRAPFIPGWDCHGLPIEHALLKELNATKDTVDLQDFRQKARAYAETQIDVQRTQFTRLGVHAEWDKPYITMDYRYEADIIRCFGELYHKGYIYKGLKPIHWSIACETALAEAEVEYADHTSPSIYVRFPVVDTSAIPLPTNGPVSILIWTTTPWTLPANRAVCLAPDERYCVITLRDAQVIVAVERLEALCAMCEEPVPPVTKTCTGKELVDLQLVHPIEAERTVPVITGDHVAMDTGTGCVHTAPGHGHEDYSVGQLYGLEVFSPVDTRGCFTEAVPAYAGMNVFKANPRIIEELQKKDILLHQETVTHSYPHCWRSHTPVIFRATEQWFLGVERHDMRAHACDAVRNVTWHPPTGEHRITGMLQQRPDWCLSRQRLWGVPIPVFYNEDTGEEIIAPSIIEHIAACVEKEGSDVWFSRDVDELLPPDVRAAAGITATRIRKETDILDVWFDSGVSHYAVVARHPALRWPADVYLEGSDQHRGWFQVSLLTAIGMRGEAPYKTVVTHGWTLTESGEKESKSKGNFTDPAWVCDTLGADILRLWVGSVNYMQDVTISPNILQQSGDTYRRIRNTFKFLLGTTADFSPKKDAVPYQELYEIDQYMLHRLTVLCDAVSAAYEAYEYHRAVHLIQHFCTIELSARYNDILKDRLYCDGTTSHSRRSAQTVLRTIAATLVRLLAPVLVFTTEEIWEHMRRAEMDESDGTVYESVHLAPWPSCDPVWRNPALEETFARIWRVRDEILRVLEIQRQKGLIGSSLDAHVRLYTTDESLHTYLTQWEQNLPSLCIVSRVTLSDMENDTEWYTGETLTHLDICVTHASGKKCARCWNYRNEVGTYTDYPDVCARCHTVLVAK